MTKPLLEVQNLKKEFPGVLALNGVHLEIQPGEVHALMGENGAGKSTLIKILTGIHPKTSGKLIFEGREYEVSSSKEAEDIGITSIYQELNLSPYQTVYENLFLGREICNERGFLDRKQMIQESEKILEDLDLHIDVTRSLNSYSTAIQQMIAIARATSIDAKLVIMDEPTSSLDPKEVEVLFDVIRRLKKRNIAVIFISHRLDEIYTICDRMTILKDGEYVGAYDVDSLSQLELISLMVGKKDIQQKNEGRDYTYEEAEKIVDMKNIEQGMHLNGIDLDLKKGEIVGIAGLLGSGRTEIAKVLFGAEYPDKGEIFWWGEEIKLDHPKDAIEKGMGFCTEDRKTEGIFPHLSVRENLSIALLPKISRFGLVSEEKEARIVDEYIDLLGIKTPSPEQEIRFLSGGNQQKVLLARWLCMDPQLVIMDEPTRGIDIGAKAEIEKLIQNLSQEGISVLMISSELLELERNCDRVIVIREGEKMGELKGKDVTEEKMMEYIAKTRGEVDE